jgi:hypothetical protein
MQTFRLSTLTALTMLAAFASRFPGQRVLADPVEPVTLERAEGLQAICNSEDIVVYGSQPPSASPCPVNAKDAGETARARAYLIATATPGYTMMRQGPERAIGRLHPEFVNRLAGAIAAARGSGLPFAGIFSAYRPPAFGVGGFADKFHSLHTYGLAVDVTGIGAAGTPPALLWHDIATRHRLICPYGPYDLGEWNHCQPTRVKIIFANDPLRETVTADGPISLESMFEIGYSLIAASDSTAGPSADSTTHFFGPSQPRSLMPVEVRLNPAASIATAYRWRAPQNTRPIFNPGPTKPQPSVRKLVVWPKGVPRIAILEQEPRGLKSRPTSVILPMKPLAMPQILAGYSPGRK